MTRLSQCGCLLVLCLAALPLAGGCDGSGGDEVNAPPPPGGPGFAQGPGGPGPRGGGPGGGASSPEIKAIMVKLNKGPNSLGSLLDAGLKAEQPAWDTIQPQAKEYAKLAGDMAKHEPARGSKESWEKLAAAFAESAAELDKAAEAKDRTAAREAHAELGNSCNSCHRQHRGGPGMGGMGPRGGPRGGGQPDFGPPPGEGPPPGPGGGPPPAPGATKK